MKIGLLGGTGIEGKGIALRFAAAGAEVVVGSRSEERARAASEECNAALGRAQVRGLRNLEMLAWSDLVFLTVPSQHAMEAVKAHRNDIPSGKVLVDVTVPLRFDKGRPTYLEAEEGSNSESIARLLPATVPVVGAFKTIPAHLLAELESPLECDLFVCGDDPEAKEKVMRAGSMIPTLRPVDAGPLSSARTLERMTVLAIHLNRHYKKKGARYKIVGLD
jgi:NADPH-dependent F420 reductase